MKSEFFHYFLLWFYSSINRLGLCRTW